MLVRAAILVLIAMLSACKSAPTSGDPSGEHAASLPSVDVGAQRAVEDQSERRRTIEVIPFDQNAYVPPAWSKEPYRFRAAPPTFENAQETVVQLGKAFRKYPKDVLTDNLKQVVLCSSMTIRGRVATGTNSLHNVYIVSCRGAGVASCDEVEYIFHHEFSSILLRNYYYRFDRDKWIACNSPEVWYSPSPADFVPSRPDIHAVDASLAMNGFVDDYARSSMEDDVNEMAAHIFVGGSEFWSAVDKSPRLKAKVELLIEFYHSISPEMTFETFRAFGK